MRFPWANTFLLAFILAELVSGFFGLVSGSPDRAIFIQTHRAAGYGILVVMIWKAANILVSLRWRRAVAPRAASLALLIALAVTMALGLTWSFAGPFGFVWFSGLSWHIYAGVALVPILVWHSLYHTRVFPISFWVDRRSFLRLGGLALMGLALWQVAELGTRLGRLGGANRRFTGSYVAPTRAAGVFPVVSWLNDRPTPVDPDRGRLRIEGAVEREMELGIDDLAPNTEVTATIDCTGGWYSEQVWRGMPVADLLQMAEVSSRAASVTFKSLTGYYRRFSLDEARRYLLATHVGGTMLSHGHGFPARLVAPGKRGFEWVKWVELIEVNETPKWLQPPLPLQ